MEANTRVGPPIKRNKKKNSLTKLHPKSTGFSKKSQLNAESIISDELKAENQNVEDLILFTTKNEVKAPTELEIRERSAKLTPKQKKRIKTLFERKRKEEERARLYASLQKNQLLTSQMSLIKSSSKIGQKGTAKETLKKELYRERMGLASDTSVPLYVPNTPSKIISSEKKDDSLINTSTPAVVSTVLKKKRKRKQDKKSWEKKEGKNFFVEDDPDVPDDKKRKLDNKNNEDSIYSSEEEETIQLESTKQVGNVETSKSPSKVTQDKKAVIKNNIPAKVDNDSDDDDNVDNDHEEDNEENAENNEDENDGDNEDDDGGDDNEVDEDDEDQDMDDDNEEEINELKRMAEEQRLIDDEEYKKNIEDKIKAKHVVLLERKKEIQAERSELPIYMEEQKIMEAIYYNDIIIVCGETGSGKTTQVPQFLYEAGYGTSTDKLGIIGVTQPRRVAAVSVARRVAEEMNIPFGEEVSYQIRYEKNVSSKTKMKFMTDGVLLRELQSDFLLKKYSAIVLDEAHERNINTDILIGLLSRVIPMRAKLAKEYKPSQSDALFNTAEWVPTPLKLIVMSATLRVEDFVNNPRLFSPSPPVIHIQSRQFPVTIHFNRVTPLDNYFDEVFRKTCKIHQKLPDGGILIFMTGQLEIEMLCAKLRKEFPLKRPSQVDNNKNNKDEQEEEEEIEVVNVKGEKKKEIIEDNGEDSEEELEIQGDPKEIAEEEQAPAELMGMLVLPLYSMLSTSKQMRVFSSPPEGNRLVIVATNVAETSITIPGVRYVVDAGKVKSKNYEGITGLSKFEITWTSKASSDQRAGRAGRTGPGHCYRLYSSAVFNDFFPKFSPPEITRSPIESVVLQMKCMGIDKIENFPFPTPPDELEVREAIKTLQYLGAIENYDESLMAIGKSQHPKITKLGKTLSVFPVAPRFAKMLALGKQGNCMPYIITVVAALSVGNPLLRDTFSFGVDEEEQNSEKISEKKNLNFEKQRKKHIDLQRNTSKAHKNWVNPLSDLLTIMRAVGAFEYEMTRDSFDSKKFCETHFLHEKSMKEIHQLRLQLMEIVSSLSVSYKTPADEEADQREELLNKKGLLSPNSKSNSVLKPPTVKQDLMLRQLIASSLIDKVATLSSAQALLTPKKDEFSSADKTSSAKISRHQYVTCNTNQVVFIHPSSVLFPSNPPPEYVVFTELIQTKKTYLKGVTAISPTWLTNLGRSLCKVEKVLEDPPPRYDAQKDQVRCWARPTYSSSCWQLPLQELHYPKCLDHYKWFARFLLAGEILPAIKRLVEKSAYVAHPSLVTRSWNIKKVNSIVCALANSDISSRESLIAIWKVNDRFLYNELEMWVKLSHRQLLQEVWLLIKEDQSTIKKVTETKKAMEKIIPSLNPTFSYKKTENDLMETNLDEQEEGNDDSDPEIYK